MSLGLKEINLLHSQWREVRGNSLRRALYWFEPLHDVLFVLARKWWKDFSCHGLMTVLMP